MFTSWINIMSTRMIEGKPLIKSLEKCDWPRTIHNNNNNNYCVEGKNGQVAHLNGFIWWKIIFCPNETRFPENEDFPDKSISADSSLHLITAIVFRQGPPNKNHACNLFTIHRVFICFQWRDICSVSIPSRIKFIIYT